MRAGASLAVGNGAGGGANLGENPGLAFEFWGACNCPSGETELSSFLFMSQVFILNFLNEKNAQIIASRQFG